jgi:hypothetical protein
MKLRSGTLIAAILSPLLALAGLAYLGTFTRLHADDFCRAIIMPRLGFWGGVVYWYNSWTGRFMLNISSLLLGGIGPSGAAAFPAIVIALWFLGLSWAFVPILRHCHFPRSGRLAMAASAMILLILFSTTPNLFQSVFWHAGQMNYTFPMIGLTLLAGVILRAWLEPAWPIALFIFISFILAFVAGGFAEVFDATQAALLILAFVLVLILADKENSRRLAPVTGAAMAGALISMVIVVIAPGNQIRQAQIGHGGASYIWIIPISFSYAARIIGKFLLRSPGWALLSILPPFLAGWSLDPVAPRQLLQLNLRILWSQSWFRALILVTLSTFLLVAAACAPTVYAMNTFPEDRSILVPQGLLVIAAVLSSGLLGAGLHRLGFLPTLDKRYKLNWILKVAILSMIILASAFSILQTIHQSPNYQSYAHAWDNRAAILLNAHQQGQTEVTVKRLGRRYGIADLAVAPDNWVNVCVADYYGFSAVRGN